MKGPWLSVGDSNTAALLVAVAGIVGMITGITSLLFSWRLASEEAEVVLTAYPTASASDLTHEGYAVRAELVNESLRPIIIRSASLWRGDEKVGDATGYVEDVELLERTRLDPAAISTGRRTLPLTLASRDGRALAFLIDVWKPIVEAPDGSTQRAARRRLNQFLGAIGRLRADEDGASGIELRLDRLPGGTETFPVRALVRPGVYPEAIRDISAIARQEQAPLWTVDPVPSREELTGLLLRRTFAGPSQVDLVRLTVWQERSSFQTAFTRPVVAQQATFFPLGDLPRGQFVAAFEVNDTVVASYSFEFPGQDEECYRGSGAGAGSAPSWCGPLARP